MAEIAASYRELEERMEEKDQQLVKAELLRSENAMTERDLLEELEQLKRDSQRLEQLLKEKCCH